MPEQDKVSSFVERFKQWRKRRREPDPADPADPYAGVRVPLRKGPGGLSAAVAVDEPD